MEGWLEVVVELVELVEVESMEKTEDVMVHHL
jgi:hypothetical protein